MLKIFMDTMSKSDTSMLMTKQSKDSMYSDVLVSPYNSTQKHAQVLTMQNHSLTASGNLLTLTLEVNPDAST
jgi:hypothetical protein